MANHISDSNDHEHNDNSTELNLRPDSTRKGTTPGGGKVTGKSPHIIKTKGNELDSILEKCLDTNPDHWPILLCLLGNFRLLMKGESLSLYSKGKAEALLSYLGLHHGRRVSREQLITYLWPTSKLTQARRSLNNLTYSVNKHLRDAVDDFILVVYEAGFYRLNLEAGLKLDIVCFDTFFSMGNQAARTGDAETAADYFLRAEQLYRGELCIDSDVNAILERERLRNCYSILLSRLATFHYQANDHATCLKYAWKLLALDPCREDAHRLIMRAYVKNGQRAIALRHYQVCVDVLKVEFNAPPETATTALFDQIRLQPDLLD